MAHDVFISYSATDQRAANAVCHRLEAAGIRCWIAPRDVGFGKDWGLSIVEAIGEAKLVVVIFSAAANASRHVLDEVGTALDAGATVIPFRIEDIRPTGALLLHLNRLHWLDALSPPLDQHIDRLIESAKRNLPAAGEGEEAQRPVQLSQEPRQQKQPPERKPFRPNPALAAVVFAAVILAVALALTLAGKFRIRTTPPDQQTATKVEAPAQPAPVPPPGPNPKSRAAPASALLRTLYVEQFIYSIAFSPDGQMLASGSGNQIIKLWDSASGQLLKTLAGHGAGIYSVAFSPDGRILASDGGDLWDVASGQLVRTLTEPNGWIGSVAFSRDGRTLAAKETYKSTPLNDRCCIKTINLWDPESGQLLRTLPGHSNGVSSLAFSPDGRTLASGSPDNAIAVWDPKSGQLLRTLNASNGSSLKSTYSVAFSPDGRTLAAGSDDKTIKLWDVSSGQLLRTLAGGGDIIYSVAFSPDGRTLASGSDDKTIKLWDPVSGQLFRTLADHGEVIYAVAFSPDGRTLASGSGDNTIKLWDVANANEARK